MSRDFWGFKDEKELIRDTKDMPDIILKEQIAILVEKTSGVLYGKPIFIKVKSGTDIDYRLATIFDVVVPMLDNYSKTILIMYSNPDTEYPVAISVENSYEDDIEFFNPKYTCKNQDEFIKSISEILSSPEVLDKIKVLYSKATTL